MSAKTRIIAVTHDAGGGEIIAAYLRARRGECEFTAYAFGPSIPSFTRRNLPFETFDWEKEKADTKAREVLSRSGTPNLLLVGRSGNGSPIETAFIRAAREAGVRSTAYLDHWVRYRESFGYPASGWGNNLPDEIWVGDPAALALARDCFPNRAVRLVPNEYFNEIRSLFGKIKRTNQGYSILFMSDIMPYGERSVFEDLISFLDQSGFSGTLMVRFHPKEISEGMTHKYDHLVEHHPNVKVVMSPQGSILDDIANADLVYGMEESMALVTAVLCGKKAVSVVPDPSRPFPLPYPEIVKVSKAREIETISKDLFQE